MQKAAKCLIGLHYPKPMVNHAEASRLNIERMKQIYQQLSCYRGLGEGAGLTELKHAPRWSAGRALTWSVSLSRAFGYGSLQLQRQQEQQQRGVFPSGGVP